MSKLQVLDLFSGIGGFSLGLEGTGGFETGAFCEVDPYCRQVLARHWPEVRCYPDVTELSSQHLTADGVGADIICGGFPCQDLSSAGKKGGIDSLRSGLWAEMARLVGEVRPRFVIVENVTDLLYGERGAWFGRVLGDLASCGYDAEWDCIPASAIGAPHVRDRLWVVAYPHQADGPPGLGIFAHVQAQVFALRYGTDRPIWLEAERPSPGVDDGISPMLDGTRAGCLGNAVVPVIPGLIGRAILSVAA